jgi:hypothetical protein
MQKKKNNNFKKIFFYNKKRNSILLKKSIEKKELQKKINNQNRYLYKNKKLKKGVFLKTPKMNQINYPFFLNGKLINEYFKKK